MKDKNTLRKSENKTAFAIIGTIIISLYSLTLIVALFWATYSAVKDRFDFFDNPLGFPTELHFENFSVVFRKLYISVAINAGSRRVFVPEMFMWSIVYAIGVSIIAQFSRCCCAYVCAKFSKYKVARVLYTVVIIVMILPIVGNLASTIQVYRNLHIYNNLVMYFLSAVGFTGQYFLIYYAAFKSVSWEYAEAAFMDGAGHFTVLLRIMIPMVKNTMGCLLLLEFIGLWNDYSTPMVYLPSYPTVAYGLYTFQFSNISEATVIPVQLAACLTVMLPILVLYVIFNKQLIGNISIGGLKG